MLNLPVRATPEVGSWAGFAIRRHHGITAKDLAWVTPAMSHQLLTVLSSVPVNSAT